MVFLSANERAEPFARPSLQKLQHYYDSVRHSTTPRLPWRSTLSRTRQFDGDDVFKKLFRQVLKQCIDKGMVAGRRQAMDSVAVKPNAAMSSLVEKQVLEDSDDYTDEINTNGEDQMNNTVSSVRNKSVQQHHKWKAEAYKNIPKGSKETKPC